MEPRGKLLPGAATFVARRGLGGSYAPPADKSITHRSLMLAAVADGPSLVRGPLATGDCLCTRGCLESLGVPVEPQGPADLRVRGVGLRGLAEPAGALDAGNSGTTMRLLSGLLAGQRLFAVMSGDGSLVRRPMGRVISPLRAMGARIEARASGTLAPLCFLRGTGDLRAVGHELAVASAQVKSAIMLAALRGDGPTVIGGQVRSRDHTERMLGSLGVAVGTDGGAITVAPPASIPGFEVSVPGDISSAAFFIAGALLSSRELEIRDCGVNPTRLGFLAVARRMGARVEVREEGVSLGEPRGVVHVSPGALRGTLVDPAEIPELVDEIPLVAVLAMFAEGVTEVRGASELRHKESDRLEAIAAMASALGGRVEVIGDGLRVEGPQRLVAGAVDPRGDHRIAMAAAIASCRIAGGVRVMDADCARVSYPDFVRDFLAAGGEVA